MLSCSDHRSRVGKERVGSHPRESSCLAGVLCACDDAVRQLGIFAQPTYIGGRIIERVNCLKWSTQPKSAAFAWALVLQDSGAAKGLAVTLTPN